MECLRAAVAILWVPLILSATVRADLVISAVQSAGVTADDEYIEFHNTSSEPFRLGGCRLVYQSSTGSSSDKMVFPELVVPARGFFLAVGSQYAGTTAADTKRSFSLSGSGAGFALAIQDATGRVLHRAAFGTSTLLTGRGLPASNAPAGHAMVRKVSPVSTATTMGLGGRDHWFSPSFSASNDRDAFVEIAGFSPRHLGDLAHDGEAPRAIPSTQSGCPGDAVAFTVQNVLPGWTLGMGLIWAGVPVPVTNGIRWNGTNGLFWEIPFDAPKVRAVTWVQPLANGGTASIELGTIEVPDWRWASTNVPTATPGKTLSLAVIDGGNQPASYRVRVGSLDPALPSGLSNGDLVIDLPTAISPGMPVTVWNPYTGVTNGLRLGSIDNGPPVFASNTLGCDRALLGRSGKIQWIYRRQDPEGDGPAPGYPKLVWPGGTEPMTATGLDLATYRCEARPEFTTNARWQPWVEDASAAGNGQVVSNFEICSRPLIRVDVSLPPKPLWVRRDTVGSRMQFSWPRLVPEGAFMVLRVPFVEEVRWRYGDGTGTVSSLDASQSLLFSIETEAGNEGPPFILPGLSPTSILPASGKVWKVERGLTTAFPVVPGVVRVEAWDLKGRYLGRLYPDREAIPPGPCLFRVITNGGPPSHHAAEVLP